MGVVAAILCNLETKVKFVFNVDDSLDVLFTLHGIGWYAGNVMTGLFAADYVAAPGWSHHHPRWLDSRQLDSTGLPNGWSYGVNASYDQADGIIMAYLFMVSFVI